MICRLSWQRPPRDAITFTRFTMATRTVGDVEFLALGKIL
jgi:hypothetical protein